MSEHIEGTFQLDGLLEGRLTDGAAQKLDDWVALMANLGLTLDLRLEGNRFSLMAEGAASSVASLGGDATGQVKAALEQLVSAIGPVESNEIFSTLRSVEIQPGTEIQTVYFVRNDDSVDVQQERLVAETSAPRRPLTPKERFKVVGISLLVIAALYGITSLFIPYGELFQSTWNKVAPLDADALDVDVGGFAEWFTVDKVEVGPGSRSVELTLKRSMEITSHNRPTPHLHAMLTGYLRVEAFDADGTFIAMAPIRVKGLDDAETLVVRIPVPKDPRPKRLVFVP